MRINIGTKSLLYGAHCFWIHPFFVARGWISLYGWTWDLRIWLAFLVHDWGYWGKPNMDGPEGETHVEWAARIMDRFFGPKYRDLCLYHSRFYALQHRHAISRLCVADKLAFILTPSWLYIPMVRSTGELQEYMKIGADPSAKYEGMHSGQADPYGWDLSVKIALAVWIHAHRHEAIF